MIFLRESWDKDAACFRLSDYRGSSCNLAMRYVATKSVVFGREPGRFDLSTHGCNLVVGNALSVDRKPGNFFHGWAKTGGKTRYCAQPARTVAGHRFHSSDRFDFAESVQTRPYYRPPEGLRRDSHAFNLYNVIPGLDNRPVTDVKVFRQVFALRGEGLHLVNTRIENASGAEHEYSQFFALPTWVPARGIDEAQQKARRLGKSGRRLVIEDPDRQFLATSNTNRPNVSIHLAASEELTFANVIDKKGNHASLPPEFEVMNQSLAKYRSRKLSARDFARRWVSHLVRPVSVRWNGKGNQMFQMALAAREASTKDGLSGGLRSHQKTTGPGGVLGWAIVTRNGTPVWFQAGPRAKNALLAGPVKANAESLMAMKKDDIISGIVLGAEAITINGKRQALKTSDAEFSLDAKGVFASTPIRRPIDTVRIAPAQNVFTNKTEVSFSIPTQPTRDIEFRYTLDGSDPTLKSALYAKPFSIDRTCMVKVRPFRKGLTATPWNFPGIDAGKTISAIFKKVSYKPARSESGLEPGLRYEYLESNWPDLFMNASDSNVIAVKGRGPASGLLAGKEVSQIRKTDMAYAIRYTGRIDIPADGVYVFHAPKHLYDVTMDAGFDLRVWIDGEEWSPSPTIHTENTWSVALRKGPHDFKVFFVDYRYKKFKNEYWLPWREAQVWQGVPKLRISGPGMKTQPLPRAMLKRSIRPRAARPVMSGTL